MTSALRRCLLVGLVGLLAAPAFATIIATRVTVATTPTIVYTAPGGGAGGTALVRNASAVSIFLGPASVTTATGFEVLAGDAVTLPTGPADPVYAVVATGTAVVHVLETNRR